MSTLLRVFVVAATLALVVVAGRGTAGADPSFGLDAPSPSLGGPIGGLFGASPGHILEPVNFPGPPSGAPKIGPSAPPLSTLPAGALGLAPGFEEVDDISYGADCFIFGACVGPGPWHFVFSVDRVAVGVPGGAVNAETFGPDAAAAADVFSTIGTFGPACAPFPTNLLADGDGLLGGGGPYTVGLGLMEPPALPPNLGQDNLDSLEMADPLAVDFAPPWEGAQEAPIFFTLDAAVAGFYGLSGSDILVSGAPYTPPGAFAVWAPAVALGLDSFGFATDDIDALAVAAVPGSPFGAPGNGVVFSLAAGSASLPAMPSPCPGAATEGDTWAAFGFTPPLGAGPMMSAEAFGLATFRSGFPNPFSATTNDELDALDIVDQTLPPSDVDGDGIDDIVDFDDDNDGAGDTIEVAAGCSPTVADSDADLMNDHDELFVYLTACTVLDTDGDGCADGEEIGPNEGAGGQRDPADFYDFFDVTGSLDIDLSDTLLILTHFGHFFTDGTDPILERYVPNPVLYWQTAAQFDGVDLADALANLKSFGHSCAGLPN